MLLGAESHKISSSRPVPGMALGGTNFLVLHKVLAGSMRSLWNTLEARLWWGLLSGFTVIVLWEKPVRGVHPSFEEALLHAHADRRRLRGINQWWPESVAPWHSAQIRRTEVRRLFNPIRAVSGLRVDGKLVPRAVGRTVAEVASRREFSVESLIAGAYRVGDEVFFIPRGVHVLKENDTVYVITRSGEIKAAAEILTNKADAGLLGIFHSGKGD